MSRPSKTFLIEAGSSRFRVDLSRSTGAYSVVGVYHEKLSIGAAASVSDGFESFDPMGSTINTDWIAPLLKKGPKAAAEVTILSDQITAVVAEIPGAPGEDWRGSASMEAQTISGLSSSESVSAFTQLPAESGLICCWVVQVAMRTVAAMREAVGSVSGTRLVSVGHPAGIRLDAVAPQLESWHEFSLFQAAGGERIDLRGWNGSEAFAEANEEGEVAAALIEAGTSARILYAGSEESFGEKEAGTVVDLSKPAGAEIWAAGLARACDPLTGQLLALPVVNVPKAPPTTKALAIKAGLIAAATAVFLGGHFLLNRFSKSGLEADLARLQEPTERVASARARIVEIRRDLKEMDDDTEDAGKSDVNVYAHRRRIGALLDGISVGSSVNGVVVLEFHPDKLDTVLTGAASSFNAPQELARDMDDALAVDGWRASLVRRTAKLLRSDGGPWSYEIRLSPGRPVSVDEPVPGTSDDKRLNASITGSKVNHATGTVAF